MWQGMINIPVAGNYTFGITSDDGSKLYIGGYGEAFKVVDNDGSHTSQSSEGTKSFSQPGAYPIVITYYQATGSTSITIYWKNTASGQIAQVNIPNSAFAPVTQPDGPVPQPPSSLTASAISFSQINLSWADNSNNENGFKIYR